MEWCNNLEEVIEFIAYVVLTAPDDFPAEDSMTVERAFDELNHGLSCVEKEYGNTPIIQDARKIFEESRAMYVGGDVKGGAWKLQDAEDILMKL